MKVLHALAIGLLLSSTQCGNVEMEPAAAAAPRPPVAFRAQALDAAVTGKVTYLRVSRQPDPYGYPEMTVSFNLDSQPGKTFSFPLDYNSSGDSTPYQSYHGFMFQLLRDAYQNSLSISVETNDFLVPGAVNAVSLSH